MALYLRTISFQWDHFLLQHLAPSHREPYTRKSCGIADVVRVTVASMLKIIPQIFLLRQIPLAKNAQSKLTSFPPQFESLFNRCVTFEDRIAIIDEHGSHSYANILARSIALKEKLDPHLREKSQQRIALLCPNDSRYVAAQWACWLGENVAVPLYREHPRPALDYYIKDSQSSMLIAAEEFVDSLQPISKDLGIPIVVTDFKSPMPVGTVPVSKQVLEDWKRLKKKRCPGSLYKRNDRACKGSSDNTS